MFVVVFGSGGGCLRGAGAFCCKLPIVPCCYRLGVFKKRKLDDEHSEDSELEAHEACDTVADKAPARPLLEDWFQARAARCQGGRCVLLF